MSARFAPETLLALLPPLRGRVRENAALGPQSWFRVGGPAEVLVQPADAADLATLLAAVPPEVPVTCIGAASNLIIRDGGVAGIVVKLGRGFAEVAADADGIVAGSAVLDTTLAEHAAAASLTGLEFLCGIPGTLGGAVVMNAGAWGEEISGCLDWAEIVTRAGDLMRLETSALGLSYRHSSLPPGSVVTRLRLRVRHGDKAAIASRMEEIRTARAAAQPVRARTGGSTFANPPGMKAWELIEAAGCRGLRHGGAMVSEKHCNFLLNMGDASAADIECLGEEVRRRVAASSGVELEWEIRRIGIPLATGDRR